MSAPTASSLLASPDILVLSPSSSSSSGGLSKRNPQPLYPSSSSTLLPSYAPSRSATPLYPGSLTPTPYVNDYSSSYPSRSGTPGGGGGYSSNKSLEGLEGQSEDRLEGLFGKVKILKDVRFYLLSLLLLGGSGS